jgi:CheY-like chemotaxis protein
MTKILLVEDDKSLREIYGVRLLAEGYDIVSAGDGEEALAMAIKEKPQLIVSDVMMPKISGFDMLDILRSTTETKDIRVIMMTALSSEDQRQRGEQLGADRYLVKSQVGIEDVVRTVHDVLGDLPGVSQAQPNFNMAPAPQTPPAPAYQPVAPAAQPAQPPVAAPAPAPVTPQPAPVAPVTPVPPAPQPTTMPQPTAPFSTNRPASLGSRVIQPISQPEAPGASVADQLAKELSPVPEPIATPAPMPQPPVAPAAQPAQPPVAAPAPAPVAPQPAPAAPTPQTVTLDNGMNFEETPRPQDTPVEPAAPTPPSPAQ